MLRKLLVIALLATLASLPAHAQWACYTNYFNNSSGAAWSFANGAYYETTLDDPCDIYFGYTMSAAALTVPNAKAWQQFTTSASTALSWTLAFEVQTQSIAGATSWDELRILVEDLTNGQSEVFFVKGNQLTSTCQRFVFTPTKNYSGHTVRVTFSAQAFTSLDMFIDNVSFEGRYC